MSTVSAIDIKELIAPIAADAPCGSDASYDADYLELERLVQGTPEKQVGNSVIPASEPDWNAVRKQCLLVFRKTKDLRVTLYLALALLQTEGLTGFRAGLDLLRRLLDEQWEALFPELDMEEPNPALERINVVAALSPREESYMDPMRFRQRLMATPLIQSPRMGRFSLRDILIAEGELKPLTVAEGSDGKAADRATIAAALADADPARLADLRQALTEAVDEMTAIGRVFAERAGVGYGPDLDGTVAILRQMMKKLGSGAISEATTAGETTASAPAASPVGDGGTATVSGTGSGGASPSVIASPQDVLSSLDCICRYYERHEPSSPVPILLKRASRLVGKSYMDIAKDLTPDAVKQIMALGGGDE